MFDRHDDMKEQANDIATTVVVWLIIATALMIGYMALTQDVPEPTWWLEFEKAIGVTW